jgi:hypothetical protein
VARVTHAEVEMTAELVRDLLLRDQHPDLADRAIALGARGWDNQLRRLGGDLAVRLPWATESADELLLKELEWLPALAPRLPLPVPVPQRLCEPSGRFPRPWIVTTSVQGEPADRAPVIHGAGRGGGRCPRRVPDGPAPARPARRARAHGRPGGKRTWGPPAHAALRRLTADAHSS